MIRKVTIESFEDGKLTITETQTYKQAFEFNQDKARQIASLQPAGIRTVIIRAGTQAYLFNKEKPNEARTTA